MNYVTAVTHGSELCPTGALPMQPHKMGETREYEYNNLMFIESQLMNWRRASRSPNTTKPQTMVDESYSNTTLQLFDCPPGTSCPVVAATEKADFVILITEPTPFGLHDLKLAVETMRKLHKPFGVVINRAGIGNDDVENYCVDERIDIISKIPIQQGNCPILLAG